MLQSRPEDHSGWSPFTLSKTDLVVQLLESSSRNPWLGYFEEKKRTEKSDLTPSSYSNILVLTEIFEFSPKFISQKTSFIF